MTNTKAFLETFDSMLEGVDYEVVYPAFAEISKYLKGSGKNLRDNDEDALKQFTFQRNGDFLIFDWRGNGWGKDTVKVDRDNPALTFTLAFAKDSVWINKTLLSIFAENRIQKASYCLPQSVMEAINKTRRRGGFPAMRNFTFNYFNDRWRIDWQGNRWIIDFITEADLNTVVIPPALQLAISLDMSIDSIRAQDLMTNLIKALKDRAIDLAPYAH